MIIPTQKSVKFLIAEDALLVKLLKKLPKDSLVKKFFKRLFL